jgi:hypothetical protein
VQVGAGARVVVVLGEHIDLGVGAEREEGGEKEEGEEDA